MFPEADATPLYGFRMQFTVTGSNNAKNTFVTDVEKFAVRGGSKVTMRKNGENGVGDADIMAEFYQAKQFLNLIATVPLTIDTLGFQRIYDRQLSFDFVLEVKSLLPESRFRYLQLNAKKARLTKPPSLGADGDTLNIKYSDPQVVYWFQNAGGSVVHEKL